MVRYITPNKDGISQGDSIKSLENKVKDLPPVFKDKAVKDLNEYHTVMDYTPPLMLSRIYNLFFDLRSSTTITQCITYSELYSYAQLTNQEFENYELKLIRRMDKVYLNAYNEVK